MCVTICDKTIQYKTIQDNRVQHKCLTCNHLLRESARTYYNIICSIYLEIFAFFFTQRIVHNVIDQQLKQLREQSTTNHIYLQNENLTHTHKHTDVSLIELNGNKEIYDKCHIFNLKVFNQVSITSN